MTTIQRKPNIVIRKQNENQIANDLVATGLSKLFGANVVPQGLYDQVNREKEEALRTAKDIDKLQMKLWRTECKLQGFFRYHKKWKPTTKKFEQRLKKLQDEKVYVDFSEYPKDIAENLKEAYKCYMNGLPIACYIMILRTIEITGSLIYSQHHELELDKNGKPKFIPAIVKLNFVKNEKMIGGAEYTVAKGFIEARNDSVHDLFEPTDKQMMSAFETVINLVNNLKVNINENGKKQSTSNSFR